MTFTFDIWIGDLEKVKQICKELPVKLKEYNDANPKHAHYSDSNRLLTIIDKGSRNFVRFGIKCEKQRIRLS